MGKNILIFSDGTGQAGGLVVDELRSNVYKLYRATRCGPDSPIDPSEQLAFYDPGLGSQSDGGRLKFGWLRRLRNVLSQATGLGITENIIDCYAAIIALWHPGDRIYLFGFSRGAYTVRCLSGVLTLCGVPTRMKGGSPMDLHPVSVRRLAREAVREVYEYGTSVEGDPFQDLRHRRAAQFRADYGSDDGDHSNAPPYFIGTFDTVAALGAPKPTRIVITSAAMILIVLLSGLAGKWLFDSFLVAGCAILLLVGCLGALLYIWGFVTYHPERKRFFRSAWLMRLYDLNLNRRVGHARHALSIDEAREDFDRVPWRFEGDRQERPQGRPPLLRQIWFAGNHADIGGSYSENESRLSDVSLSWMIEQLRELEHPILLNAAVLHLFPSPLGPQHDECKVPFPGIFGWLGLRWKSRVRPIRPDAPLHPSVLERFAAPEVQQFDVVKPYRPEALRHHNEVGHYYDATTP